MIPSTFKIASLEIDIAIKNSSGISNGATIFLNIKE
ncbi:hypothetical protein SAMN05421842_12738 [Clostridium uliginosum]|uniref:Uncharacterized protein n=1 Tax=Clostridium uliginosum TaxID=119641 RepID=A0A1I1QZU8_9CLOT|nr:hypothetical protein SAMN05421842_12738 [Clostridium uliginosum]